MKERFDVVTKKIEGKRGMGMAVQAQYPSPLFMVRNSINNTNTNTNNASLEEFSHHRHQRDNVTANLVGGYNNYDYDFGVGEGRGTGHPILNGATVFSDLESELTCNNNNNNNMSASRKRTREPPQQQQQLVHHHLLQQQQQQQHQFVNKSINVNAPIFSGLEDNRQLDSRRTSTSGRTTMASPFLLAQDLTSNLFLHQNLEIDTIIRLQTEKLWVELENARKRHCRSMISVMENEVLKKFQEKDAELANANLRNAELLEKIKQMSAENQIWFNVAKNNEVIASNLKSTLEQVLIQNQNQAGQIKEGFGDSGEGNNGHFADDAQSYCNEGGVQDEGEKMMRENQQLKENKLCTVCRENDVSVLLLPCRHLCLCKKCDSKIEACPTCKCVKKASLQIFIS